MSQLLPFTGIRLLGEYRTGAVTGVLNFFADDAGDRWRVVKVTHHHENGDYYFEYTYTGFADEPYEVTDTDYDENFNGGTNGSGYGAMTDPEEYEFSIPANRTDLENHIESAAPEWEEWTQWFNITGKELPAVFAMGLDNIDFATGQGTTYTIGVSDPGFEGGLGAFSGSAQHLEARFTILTPIPGIVRYAIGDEDAATHQLIPGISWSPEEAPLVPDEVVVIHYLGITWLPWSA